MTTIVSLIGGFTAGALLIFLFLSWRNIRPVNRFVVFMFAVMTITSSFTKVALYEPGIEPAPYWFSPMIDLLRMSVSIGLIISVWTHILNGRKDNKQDAHTLLN